MEEERHQLCYKLFRKSLGNRQEEQNNSQVFVYDCPFKGIQYN